MRFPNAWLWLVDEAIPNWVKNNYSPKDGWKNKPFTEKDAGFFFKGIQELSELFTEERPRRMPAYLTHPKFRSSYLLYFLPLQAAKFSTIFQLHPQAAAAALRHGQETGTLKIVDLGAGPGTASFAFLLWILEQKFESQDEIPKIEFDWFDTNRSTMEDGKKIIELFCLNFPRLRGRVIVRSHVGPWTQAAAMIRGETSLVLMGHVLNEASGMLADRPDEYDMPEDSRSSPIRPLVKIFEKMRGGGILMVEPAERRSSQMLSQIRDEMIEAGVLEAKPTSIWGPCLHGGRCPLATGRDWCHFSVPADVPGKWFKIFSKNLSSEKQWVKFSYIWLAAPSTPAITQSANLRRVVSDPMKMQSLPTSVLLCEPEHTGRLEVPINTTIKRGDLINSLQKMPEKIKISVSAPVKPVAKVTKINIKPRR